MKLLFDKILFCTIMCLLVGLSKQESADVEALQFNSPAFTAQGKVPFDNCGDLRNHKRNCTLKASEYFMMVGCDDGWTSMARTSTFLNSIN